jgi:hypothetical protein
LSVRGGNASQSPRTRSGGGRPASMQSPRRPVLRHSDSFIFLEVRAAFTANDGGSGGSGGGSPGGGPGGGGGVGRGSSHAQELARDAVLRVAYEQALFASSGGAAGPGGPLRLHLSTNEALVIAAHLACNCAPFRSWPPAIVARLVLAAEVVDAVAVVPLRDAAVGHAPQSPLPSTAGSDVAGFGGGGGGGGSGGGSLPAVANAAAAATAAAAGDLSLLRPRCMLYERGVPVPAAEACLTLVLQGELDVVAGADAVRSVAGPWDLLAERALTESAGGGTDGAGGGSRTGGGDGSGRGAVFVADFSAKPRSPIARVLRVSRALFETLLAQARDGGGGGGGGSGGSCEPAAALGSSMLRVADRVVTVEVRAAAAVAAASAHAGEE